MINSEKQVLANSQMIEVAFDFWLGQNEEHIRSPFPEYIRHQLKPQSIEGFEKWINHLKPDAKDEMNEEMFADKFEEILFETAAKLVLTEDENITILYPFMPRTGDIVKDVDGKEGTIVDRNIKKDGDTKFLEVSLINKENKESWKTSFELPM